MQIGARFRLPKRLGHFPKVDDKVLQSLSEDIRSKFINYLSNNILKSTTRLQGLRRLRPFLTRHKKLMNLVKNRRLKYLEMLRRLRAK